MQAVGKKLQGERAEAWQDWLRRYRAKLRAEGLPDDERRAMQNAVNPAYIPRNQLMQRAIEAAEAGDFAPVSHCMTHDRAFGVRHAIFVVACREGCVQVSSLA